MNHLQPPTAWFAPVESRQLSETIATSSSKNHLNTGKVVRIIINVYQVISILNLAKHRNTNDWYADVKLVVLASTRPYPLNGWGEKND